MPSTLFAIRHRYFRRLIPPLTCLPAIAATLHPYPCSLLPLSDLPDAAILPAVHRHHSSFIDYLMSFSPAAHFLLFSLFVVVRLRHLAIHVRLISTLFAACPFITISSSEIRSA